MMEINCKLLVRGLEFGLWDLRFGGVGFRDSGGYGPGVQATTPVYCIPILLFEHQ